MAIFNKKDDKKAEEKADKKVAKKAPKKEVKKATKKPAKAPAKKSVKKERTAESKLGSFTDKNLSAVLLKPRITEKAAVKADMANAYTFNVAPSANKNEVAAAIEKIYKVVPVKVNIMKTAKKAVRNRRGTGYKGGGKKAIVFLKKGDKIEFV